jgi:NAD(P)-dependent dehydrogenase (short-subunit alcohol dehydrogenase family)
MPTDPRTAYPQPPFRTPQQPMPGHEAELNPKADHGETSYKGSGKLQDMVALITGADSGIGRAVAIAFAREGADVVISYLDEEEDDARETAKWVEQAGRKALLVPGNITQQEHCQALVNATIDKFGKLDVLVNNAAYQKSYQHITEVPANELDLAFRTNVYAMFWLCQAAVTVMKPGASIINTSSINAYDPSPMLLPYATTKGAIADFTKGLAGQLVKEGIRVNSVAPGPVWTPLIPSTTPPSFVENFGSQSPMGRPAQPAELAPVFVLLASPQASYITGMIYGVTGGQLTA